MYAAVPVKSLSQGKQRLSPLLNSKQRAEISRAMTSDVLSTLRDSQQFTQIFICSNEPQMAVLAREFGAELVLDQDSGARDLNTAIDALAQRLGQDATQQDSVLLTAHSDLPLLQTRDIAQLLAALQNADLVLAPDRHGQGSNILARRLGQAFAAQFGENSLQRHRQQAGELQLRVSECRLHGSGWDMDRPEDIHDALYRFGLAAFGPATQQFLMENRLIDESLLAASAIAGSGETSHAIA